MSAATFLPITTILSVPCFGSEETRRLRRAFDALPKTTHGEQVLTRHSEVRPEWVMHIVESPYDQWQESDSRTGEPMTILIGRIPNWNRWVKVVFEGHSPATGRFETAHSDRRLEKRYGGRPWQNQTPI